MSDEPRQLSDDELVQVSGGLDAGVSYCPPGYIKCPNPRCDAYTAYVPYKVEDIDHGVHQLQYYACGKCGYEWTEVY